MKIFYDHDTDRGFIYTRALRADGRRSCKPYPRGAILSYVDWSTNPNSLTPSDTNRAVI